jgi:hypothetical protein
MVKQKNVKLITISALGQKEVHGNASYSLPPYCLHGKYTSLFVIFAACSKNEL